jgi:peptidoglycan/LPS O-acetylase OafA/YrhL
MLGLIVGFAYLSYLMFESKTNRVRRKLKSVLLRREPRTAQEAMLSPD